MSEAGVPAYTGKEYQPLTRFECFPHYSLRNCTPIPKKGIPIADSVLTRILTKIPDEGDPHLHDSDREMSEFVMDRMAQCFDLPDDFTYEVSVNGVMKYRTLQGDFIHAKVAFATTSVYRLLDMKQIARVGDYYYSLRQRPDKKSSSYEYIPNKKYSYRAVKRTLAQISIQVTASRYWSDLALSTLSDHQLHPYCGWCPGLSLDLYAMDVECGLAHFPIGAEIIDRTDIPAFVNGKRKQHVDNHATVARLYKLGVMDTQSRESLLSLKAVLDANIETAKQAIENSPFSVAHRLIQVFLNRWKLVSRSIDVTANPHNPHGPRVYNGDADPEAADRKRKAEESSLTASSPSIHHGDEEDDAAMAQQQQDAPTDQDRQNPEGSGGNLV